MKAAFFHDSRLKLGKDNNYYTAGGLTYDYLIRYLNVFESVTIVTRRELVEEVESFKIVSGENIEFNCVNNIAIKNILNGNIKKIIKEEVSSNDFAIIRLPSVIGSLAFTEVRKQHKPYLIEMVGCPFDSLWNYGSLKGKFVAPIMYLITKNILKKSKNVIYVSNKFLQQRYPNNYNNIGCSDVNIEKIDLEIYNNRVIKIKNKAKGEVYKLGIIGSLNVNYKGHEVAIKAMSLLKGKIDFELHFLGSGNKEKWAELAKKYNIIDNIFFDGTLPGGQAVYKWLDKLDIYLIPSKQEGLPRALVEAMSRSCPCIGSNIGGIVELIDTKYQVNPNDYKKLSKLIYYVLNNKQEMCEMSKANFEKSKNYEKAKLDFIRNEFYKEILSD